MTEKKFILSQDAYTEDCGILRTIRSRAAALFLILVSLLQPIEAFPAETCGMTTTFCTDATPCKTINNVNVCLNWVTPLPAMSEQTTLNCWNSTSTYQCADPTNPNIDTCSTFESDPSCGVVNSTCVGGTDSQGNCMTQSLTYQCTSTGASTTSTNCGGVQLCQDGTCYVNPDAPNNTLVQAVTAVEAAREAAFYMDPVTQQVFSGESHSCTINTLGLANCCKPNSQGKNFSNSIIQQSILQNAAVVGLNITGAYSYIGSGYTFDSLFDNVNQFLSKEFSGIPDVVSSYTGDIMPNGNSLSVGANLGGMVGQQLATSLVCSSGCSPGLTAIVSGLGSAAGNIAGQYGAAYISQFASTAYTTFMNGATAAQAATYGDIAAGNAMEAVSICTPCLVTAVSITIIMALLACDQSDVKTEMLMGANLCHFVGSYCSEKVLFWCLQNTNSYCCFNSVLSKIINEQGRPQIGKGYGGAQSPDCSGFTVAQVQQLDFSTMDFSAFYSSVVATSNPNSTQLASQAASAMANFYDSTSAAGTTITSTNGVIPQPNQMLSLTVAQPPSNVPSMPACTITVAKNPPMTNGSQTGSITLTSCQPAGQAVFNYSGTCSSLTVANGGGSTPYTINGTGSVTANMLIPLACAGETNTWNIFIADSNNNLLGTLTTSWQ